MKKRIVKALSAALLAFALVVMIFPVSAFAAGNSTLPPSSGTLIIHKYALEDLSGADMPNDGTAADRLPSGATPLAGIEFSVWKINTSDDYAPSTPSEASRNLDISSERKIITGSDGTATLTLARGHYYIQETGYDVGENLSSYLPCEPFLVSVPMTNASGNGWLENVHVYPKNQPITIDKFVNAANADYDFVNTDVAKARPVFEEEEFGWTIQATIPANIGNAGNEAYSIRDELNTAFDFVSGSVIVYSIPTRDTSSSSANVLRKGTDYTEVFDSGSNTLTIELTGSGLTTVGQRYINQGDRFIMIKFNCKLNDTAAQCVDIENGATVEYSRNAISANYALMAAPDTDASVSSSVFWKPSVHTGQIGITKVDGNKKLSGAEFGLAATKAEAAAGTYLATGTTDSNGRLVFQGVLYGVPGDLASKDSGSTKYWLVETKAPTGYQILSNPIEVVFNYQEDKETGEFYFNQVSITNLPIASTSSKEIPESPKPGIPKTGMNIMFITFGAMLLSMAVIILLWRSKRKATPSQKVYVQEQE